MRDLGIALLLLLPLTVRVWIAGRFNNPGGRSHDIHGRTYRYVYRKYGHSLMVEEAREGNTWHVPRV
jgi:hypothetical protein